MFLSAVLCCAVLCCVCCCSIGQNLAKLELQVVLSMLLSRFKFSPGPELHKELELAAATGQPRVSALHALAGVHVTLQPQSGSLELCIQPRSAV
jgi:hypothetical protein